MRRPARREIGEGRAIEIQDTELRGTVAFDERLTALAGLIGSVDRPGGYCAHGRMFAPMPRILLSGVGVLSFPVPPAQLEALIEGAARAPYGKGEDTLVDRSVRDCRQIAPGRIDVGGRTWGETLDDILVRAAEGLGCPKDALGAELYKLLIYEPGGFFAPHRDTEKADRMLATLAIALPVAGMGGDLVIRHGGGETVVDMRTEEPSELVWAAFYADCEHETLPVTAGHRVCLIYNLVLKRGSIPAAAPDYGARIDPIAAELEARCLDPGESGKKVSPRLEMPSMRTRPPVPRDTAPPLPQCGQRRSSSTPSSITDSEATPSGGLDRTAATSLRCAADNSSTCQNQS